MARTLLSVIISATIAWVIATGETSNNGGKIVGGEPAPLGSVPYQVSVYHGGGHACGGAIVGPNTIVTAAHCCFSTPINFKIHAGLNSMLSPESGAQLNLAVKKIIRHPGYAPGSYDNDICIMKLKKKFVLSPEKRTAAISLPPEGYIAAGQATVTGWGLEYEGGRPSSVLMTVNVTIFNDDECRKLLANTGLYRNSMLCAGEYEGGKDSCQGDSGGPLVDSKGLLVGITSWGIGCARPNKPGVYTETSYYSDWVKTHLSN